VKKSPIQAIGIGVNIIKKRNQYYNFGTILKRLSKVNLKESLTILIFGAKLDAHKLNFLKQFLLRREKSEEV